MTLFRNKPRAKIEICRINVALSLGDGYGDGVGWGRKHVLGYYLGGAYSLCHEGEFGAVGVLHEGFRRIEMKIE